MNTTRTARSGICAACLAVCFSGLLAASCGPVRLSATLGEVDTRLKKSVVINEYSARGDIAIIDVRGLITDTPRPGLLSAAINPVDRFVSELNHAREDRSVRAVVVRINSPGGGVTASDIMYRELRRFAEETNKPVIASLGSIAASGGYYVALGADEIVTERSSITGSIGVILPTFNLSDGMGRIGIRGRAVVSGPNKDLANPFQPMVEDHYDILQNAVDDYYATFRELVSERRKITGSNLDQLADGRILSGNDAVEAGLADSTGGIREAFAVAKQRSGLQAARLVSFYPASSPAPTTPYASPVPTLTSTESGVLGTLVRNNWLEPGRAYYIYPAAIEQPIVGSIERKDIEIRIGN